MPNEVPLNAYLATVLQKSNIEAEPECTQPNGKFIDVRCVIGNKVVAIEAKHGYSNSMLKGAVSDANERLAQDLCDVAIALVYPDEYKTLADLEAGEIKAHVRTQVFDANSAELTRQAKKAQWRTIKTSGFADYVQKAPEEIGSPDALAHMAEVAVASAAAKFTADEETSILRKMGDGARGTNLKGLLTDLLTAVMFHTKLDVIVEDSMPEVDARKTPPVMFNQAEWRPKTVLECRESEQIATAFEEAHDLWLAVDYKQILEWSCAILRALPDSPSTNAALHIIARAAVNIQRSSGGQHHDLVGITFCQSLETAKNDGSMYTTIPAASLLAHLLFHDADLDWSDFDQVTSQRIVDFACGTGTLLIAAANYILQREQTGRREEVAEALLERVLYGFDVNNRAIFQTATGLGMIAPRVAFRRMHLYSLMLGINPPDGRPKIGSLEMLDGKDQLSFNPRPATATRIDSTPAPLEADTYDIAIMNPPFTRDSLRHDQFGRKVEIALKKREKAMLDRTPVHRSGNSNGFLVLAEKHLEANDGRMGFVLPLGTATYPSALATRQMLAKKFHIKFLVVSYDPRRIYCSGNTQIGEMLIVLERKQCEPSPPTAVIKLTQNPASASDAIACAESIIGDHVEAHQWGFVDLIPSETIESGDWSATQFADPRLHEIARSVPWTKTLGNQFEIVRTDLQGNTEKCGKDERFATPALYDHKESHCDTLEVEPDRWVKPVPGKPRAQGMMSRLTSLKLPFRMSWTSARTSACLTSARSVGAAWYGAIPVHTGEHSVTDVEKAVCLILNSTIGKISMLLVRNNKKPSYSKLSIDGLQRIPIPSIAGMTPESIQTLSGEFDRLKKLPRLPFPDAHKCPVQIAIDKAVCDATDYDQDTCDDARFLLAQEPLITGKPYNAHRQPQTRLTHNDFV